MSEETFVDRMREVYSNERSWTLGKAGGDATDVRDIQKKASLRVFNEIAQWDEQKRNVQILNVIQLAMTKIGQRSDKTASPKFTDEGHALVKLDGVLRVGENLILGVQYATEDDWLAYLGIKRKNYERQERNWHSTETGVYRIVADHRSYGQRFGVDRPKTIDACPYLFERQEEAAA